MKLLAVAVVVLSFLFGCGDVQTERLPGSWQLTRQEVHSKTKFGESLVDNNVPDESSFLYVFQDGQMSIPNSYQGTYQLDGSQLTILGSDGTNFEFAIQELNEDTLKLEKKTEQGETEEKIVLTFKRVGGFTQPGVVNPADENHLPATNHPVPPRVQPQEPGFNGAPA